ncbi:beta-hydroxyacyl-ACP dehydratase [Zobellia nedashkovskayae]
MLEPRKGIGLSSKTLYNYRQLFNTINQMETEIEKLIPHRFPFLFVDKIISADENEVIGIKSFDKSIDKMLTGSFPDFNYIPGMILIESMAQCGGAGIKKAGLAEGLFGLVSMGDVIFLKGATYGEEIKYVIKNVRVSNRLIKQTGIAYSRNEPIVEATWVCARIDKS